MDVTSWVGLGAVCFIAAVLQATSGFGFAVIAVPFFLLLAPPGEAIRLIVIISLATSLFVLPRLYRYANAGLLRRLTLGSLVALPFGLIAASRADATTVRVIAGVVVTGFAVALAWHRYDRSGRGIVLRPFRDLGVGVIAGLATAMVGMAGPPPLIYLMLGGAPMRTVRATLIGFFAIIYAVTLAANVAFVGLPGRSWLIALTLLPPTWIGGRVGLRVGDRLGEAAAAILALIVLGATGLYTLGAVLW